MPEAKINPYNFVPLGSGPDRSRGYPGQHRVQDNAYSGILECRLIVLSPLISADHRNSSSYELKNSDGTNVKIPYGRRKGQVWGPIKVFRFLRNGNKNPIIQGASLKGMSRSVYEAMTDACLPLVATTGKSANGTYQYKDLTAYRGNACKDIKALCPACRLFGTIEGDEVHCQGRVQFTDAVLTKSKLREERRFLSELSSPKPHHSGTYGQGDGNIAGRKFYYHHGDSPNFSVREEESNDRSSAIDEIAPIGAEFSFQVLIHNLEPEEVGRLLLTLELDEGLGHKIGMGKALGLGSCRIVIDKQHSRLSLPSQRYGGWRTPPSSSVVWESLKPNWQTLPDTLIEILRLNKAKDGLIGYPNRPYPYQPIDALGVFGGSATIPGMPERPVPQAAGPIGDAPRVKGDEQAAWLREIREDELLLVAEDGKEMKRPRRGYQGKEAELQLGHWFILWGQNAVRPVRRRR